MSGRSPQQHEPSAFSGGYVLNKRVDRDLPRQHPQNSSRPRTIFYLTFPPATTLAATAVKADMTRVQGGFWKRLPVHCSIDGRWSQVNGWGPAEEAAAWEGLPGRDGAPSSGTGCNDNPPARSVKPSNQWQPTEDPMSGRPADQQQHPCFVLNRAPVERTRNHFSEFKGGRVTLPA